MTLRCSRLLSGPHSPGEIFFTFIDRVPGGKGFIFHENNRYSVHSYPCPQPCGTIAIQYLLAAEGSNLVTFFHYSLKEQETAFVITDKDNTR